MDARGEASLSYVALIALVGLLGAAAFTSVGGSFDTAIGSRANGGVPAAPVASMAGEAPAPPPPNGQAGSGGGTGGDGTVVSAEAGSSGGELSAEEQAALDAVVEDVESQAGERGAFEGCGWNPFCYPARAWSGGAGWVSDHVGDIPVLGPVLRFAGGLVDGVWDGLFEIGRGLKEATESIFWDFAVEDVVFGILGPPLKLLAQPVNAIFGTHLMEDMSWIPLKDAATSLGHFVVSIPRAWSAVTNAWHQLSLCGNPWNGQSSEDRGHACGETVVVVADIVIGAKGVAKTAEAIRAARAARAGTAAEAGVAADVAVAAGGDLATVVREALSDVPGAARLPQKTIRHIEEAANALKLSESQLRRLIDDVVAADVERMRLIDDVERVRVELDGLDTSRLYPSERAAIEAAQKELESARNNLRDHTTPSDLVGAVRDVHGNPIVKDGVTYNHLGEVQGSVDTLRTAERVLTETTAAPKNPNLTVNVPTVLDKLGRADIVSDLADSLGNFADFTEDAFMSP